MANLKHISPQPAPFARQARQLRCRKLATHFDIEYRQNAGGTFKEFEMRGPGQPSFDQLAVFLSVVETGSFAAAGRELGRATSAISYTIANLELQLGLPLFDRDRTRKPTLTKAGAAVLSKRAPSRSASTICEPRSRVCSRASNPSFPCRRCDAADITTGRRDASVRRGLSNRHSAAACRSSRRGGPTGPFRRCPYWDS